MNVKLEIANLEDLLENDIGVLEIWENEQNWYGGTLTREEIENRIKSTTKKLDELKHHLY